VTELKKKQDGDTLREHSISLPHTNISTEKGPAPISLNAPAINTGGRDAMALKTSIVPGSSSALDLIKKKLQDSGAPGTSSPGPAPSGTVGSELNGSGAVDTTVKGLQSGDSRDKQKDANGDGNMSDSTSDSEDADSGPTKEECIIQFKVFLASVSFKKSIFSYLSALPFLEHEHPVVIIIIIFLF
jgi:transcription elongation regulator 1